MPKPFTAWSYSRWDLHHQCPLKFKLEVIDGMKEPPNAAMENGRRVHKAAEAYLTAAADLGPVVPDSLGYARPLAQELRNFENKVVEQQWGYTRTWQATGWFGTGVWFRSVCDVAVLYDDMTAEVIDWKTGKPRGTHPEQMQLFAMSVMLRQAPITHVTTRLAYTDAKHEEFGEFSRSDLPAMLRDWEKKVAPMFEDTTYLPRPNDRCGFCQFSRSKGGQCRYG